MHSLDQTTHLPSNSREGDIVSSWCRNYPPSWKSLQQFMTLHLKHQSDWKKWRQTLSVGSTPVSQKRSDIDRLRMKLFSHKTKDVERISPTYDALNLYVMRSVYQASIWTTAYLSMIPVHNPTDHGWKEEDGMLLPVWSFLTPAKDVFHLDVKCSYTNQCSRCKYMKAKLKCTRLCQCKCKK